MREIKFNFFDTIKKKYIRWGESNAGMSMSAFITHEHLESLQYTGLTDKNGREIVEGDIIQHQSGIRARVVYVPEHAAYLAHYILDGNAKYEYLDFAHSCEVIGNIYENANLLEGNTA